MNWGNSGPEAFGFRHDMIADLSLLGLTEEHKEKRRGYIGGSDATIIAKGDVAEVNKLALVKRGLAEGDNLDDELPVQLGQWTEAFNLAWYEKKWGTRPHSRGRWAKSARYSFMACTLDGWDDELGGPINAKHVNTFWKRENLLAHYTAQMHHEMLVTGAKVSALSVIFGNGIGKDGYARFVVELDPIYAGELVEAEHAFWEAVKAGRDPLVQPPEPPPIPKSEMIEIDMAESNSFAEAAACWRDNYAAAEDFKAAADDLKNMMPPNASRIFAHGIEVVRDGRGRTVRQTKQQKAEA